MARAVLHDNLWAGTEQALSQHLELEGQAATRITAGWNPQADEEEEECIPYLLDIQGSIGVINISGPLKNAASWWDEFMGAASYEAIREALVYAAACEEVQHILLTINSGGGAVNGVSDCGDLIRMVNDKVKPVTAFTDGNMCSAAYWLGCSAGELYASNVSTVGSIGVIATHMEYSKQLKDEGVTATVFRGGRYKALVNSVEPLTEAAKAQFQSQIDAAERVFVSYVADMRSRTYDYTYEHMAQGREFFGEQALAAGLVDGITNYDKVVSMINAKIASENLDTQVTFPNTSRNLQGANNMTKKALSEQEIAALAEGGLSAGVSEPVSPENPEQPEAQAAVEPTPVEAEASVKPENDLTAESDSSLVAYLQGQVKDKDAALLAATVELNQLKASVADHESAVLGLMAIASQSINNMRIALGGSAADFSKQTATAVLAEHQQVTEAFAAKFKAGGVAAVGATGAKKEGDELDHMLVARLNSVRPTAHPAK